MSASEPAALPSRYDLGITVVHCAVCGLPPEYCEFGGSRFNKCKPWLMKHCPEVLKGKLSPEEETCLVNLSLEQEERDHSAAAASATDSPTDSTQIWVSRMARKGNKNVTVVFHLEKLGLKPKQVAKQMQSKFACGSSVQKGNPPSVLIQGDVSDEVAHYLVTMFKVPKEKVFFYNLKKKLASPAFD